ncbi:MAG: M60 family metallopeptidase [Acholeplasmatales bacterium]|nr:M60 family metallopeptidase [Acholeplasmatales bacterium]
MKKKLFIILLITSFLFILTACNIFKYGGAFEGQGTTLDPTTTKEVPDKSGSTTKEVPTSTSGQPQTTTNTNPVTTTPITTTEEPVVTTTPSGTTTEPVTTTTEPVIPTTTIVDPTTTTTDPVTTTTTTADPIKLAAPVITLSGKVVTWASVPNATYYGLYINNDTPIAVAGVLSGNVTYTIDRTDVGTYNIKVIAFAFSDEYIESDYSNTVQYVVSTPVTTPVKLATPELLVLEDARWNPVDHATSYKLYINNDYIEVTGTSYDLNIEEEGSYEIRVKAVSTNPLYLESDFSNSCYIVIHAHVTTPTQLDAPTISLSGNVVSWSSVEDAVGYDIYINSENPIRITTTSYTINKTEAGTYKVKVKAITDDINMWNSEYSNEVTYTVTAPEPTKISAPVITLGSNNSITWNAVDHATSYEIYVNGNTDELTVNPGDLVYYYAPKTEAGTYTIKVKAKTTDTDYLDSDYSNVVTYTVSAPEPTKMSAPVITLNDNVVSWTAVEHATSYNVYINTEAPVEVTATSYEITKTEAGTYTIKVKAITTNSDYLDSDNSNEVTYTVTAPEPTKISAPVITLGSNNGITWNAVDHATSYEINVNGDTDELTVNPGALVFYYAPKTEPGSYTIKVKAKTTDTDYLDSDYSNEVSYTVAAPEPTKMSAPVITLNDNVVSWTAVEHATSYNVYINTEAPVEVATTSYEITKTEAGTYTIKVKAITTNSDYLDSDNSNEVSYVIKEYPEFTNKASSLSRVGEYTEILGTVPRQTPTVSNGGLSSYPSYYVNFTDTSMNQALTDENDTLIASSSTYDSMDSTGKLYLNGTYTGNNLYKHSASVGLYGGDVADSEPAVIKKIIISSPRLIGNYLTGLYAPAGEVIKIEISQADLDRTGGLDVIIGMSTGRNQTNDIEIVKTFNRMPKLQNKMAVSDTVTYVGSYFGGPIYIYARKSAAFEVTITGAVEYLHYIDGSTSEDEFNRLLNTTAPYLDMEVYDQSVRFSGPRYTLYGSDSTLGYENAVDVMTMWQNFNITSRLVPHGMNTNAFITMLFDTYIKANAGALAFVGADYATLPVGWMSGALTYETFMLTGGWGAIHEFNHHFQKFGCNGNNNEVTNNVMNFIEYILYTRITEYRNYTSISHGAGLNSHGDIEYLNTYRDYIDSSTGNLIELRTEQGYAILVENFGPELMLEVFRNQGGITTIDAFYKAMTETIKMDFEFFFKELWHLTVTQSVIDECKAYNYPTYVPVGSYYSSSFSFKAIGNESLHALPYICDKDFIIDLGADINTVTGYSVEILEVMNPTIGTLTKLSGNVYRYQTDSNDVDSFKVRVKVYNSTYEEEVTITFDLNPINQGIEVTTYKYDNLASLYTNIDAAYAADFAGYTSVSTKYQTAQRVTGIATNTVVVVKGKFLIPEDGTYTICYMGGRGSSMFYASVNSTDNFEKIGYILINQSGYMLHKDAPTAFADKTMELKAGDEIYYIQYIYPTSDNAFLEIGYTTIINPDRTDVKKVDDKWFRGFNGSFDVDNTNYDLRNNNITPKDYEYKNIVDYETLHATSDNFVPWSDQFGLDKIFDGDSSTYAHTQQNVTISQSNPVDIVISCDNEMSFNAIKFYGTAKNQCPITFDLYIYQNDEFVLLQSYTNLTVVSNTVTITFDNNIHTSKIKVHVTKTTPQYLALVNIEIYESHSFKSISLGDLKYYGNIEILHEASTYGHLYKLSTDSYLEYEFEDSISLGMNINSTDYKVYIDDVEVEMPNELCSEYLYDIYEFKEAGSHKIKILVNDGYIKLYDVLKVK